MPIGEAERCVAALRAAGYAGAAVIGLVTGRSGALKSIALDPTGEKVAEALAQALHAGSDRPREFMPAREAVRMKQGER